MDGSIALPFLTTRRTNVDNFLKALPGAEEFQVEPRCQQNAEVLILVASRSN